MGIETQLEPLDPAVSGADARRVRVRHVSRSTQFLGFVAILLVFKLNKWAFARVADYHRSDGQQVFTYAGEGISWEPCGAVEGRSLECSTVTVPMDHFDARNNAAGQSFSIPLMRLRSRRAIRNLLLNPGGPASSGTQFLYRRGAQLSAIVGEGFHLVGFDPRGVNASRPLGSCYPTDEARRSLAPGPLRAASVDSGELWAQTANFVRACADTMGEYAAHVNTLQTAADMNSILDALGQEDMYYWGFSYGTLLGQTYATLFPARSKRVVLDGVANQFHWYNSLMDEERMVDSDRVLEGFLDECVKAGPEACALASPGKTKEDLGMELGDLEELRFKPISVYLNNTAYGILDYETVWLRGIFAALRRPETWHALASNLAALLRGNATDTFLAYGWQGPTDLHNDAQWFIGFNDGVSGPDHWPRDHDTVFRKITSTFGQSMFSEDNLIWYLRKAAWPISPTLRYSPKQKVQTAHPLLLLSTTYDPVCPLVSAKSANDVFTGSRIVEVKGYGHCSIAVPSVCAARHVREFLYNGKLPDKNVQCEVDGKPYFVKPVESAIASSVARFQDLEEQRIHLAQVELARGPMV